MANYDLSTRLAAEQAQLEQKEAQIQQVLVNHLSLVPFAARLGNLFQYRASFHLLSLSQ